MAIYHLLNSAHQPTIISELKGILEQVKDSESDDDEFYRWGGHDIPELGIRLNVPKIPGQDTSAFKNWPHKMHGPVRSFTWNVIVLKSL